VEALGLFGGREAVVDRMTSKFTEGLRNLQYWEIELWQDSLALGICLFDFASGDQPPDKVDFETFSKLSGPLGLSTAEILGPAKFSDESKPWWERQVKERPLYVAGCLGRTGTAPAPAVLEDIDAYVLFRAIQELEAAEVAPGD